MILAAHDECGVDLSRSVLVGDKLIDIEAGARAGVGLNILVSTEIVDHTITSVQCVRDVIHCWPCSRSWSAATSPRPVADLEGSKRNVNSIFSPPSDYKLRSESRVRFSAATRRL